ncbi:MAG: hypothetical protein LBL28_00385 [Treponema sp.]|jgi:hypothetical protein|nr:hypothetical protein [Treponema sp.]
MKTRCKEQSLKGRRVPGFLAGCFFFAAAVLAAQDFGFGFGGEDTGDFSGQAAGTFAVSIGGEIKASISGFVEDFADGADHTQLGDIFSGKLRLSAETSRAAGVINLNLSPSASPATSSAASPLTIDEAYLRVYLGRLDLEGGLRKLSWGRADSLGPLDVVNPLDYSDVSNLSDMAGLKIARPLIHASLLVGQFSKLEGIFVPNFEPVRFADTGHWAPAQLAMISQIPPANVSHPDTATLDYAQAGLRFTTTIGGAADIGLQYYYGRLTTPALILIMGGTPPSMTITGASFAYNPYHQIGADWAQVIAGFNLRAEAAANITYDTAGDDAGVYNPSLAWSLGFDRDLFWGINLNAQCNETIRLFDGKIKSPLDIEAGSDITTTRITAALSKRLLRDELEIKAAAIWETESGACLIMPAITWTKDDISAELSGGAFAGNREGLFGQFRDNSFIKAGVRYSF